jgi:hypothetical protein
MTKLLWYAASFVISKTNGVSLGEGLSDNIISAIVETSHDGDVVQLVGFRCGGGKISSTGGRLFGCSLFRTLHDINLPIILSSLVVMMKGSEADGLEIELAVVVLLEFFSAVFILGLALIAD